jgi:hypothetical protein
MGGNATITPNEPQSQAPNICTAAGSLPSADCFLPNAESAVTTCDEYTDNRCLAPSPL